MAIRKFTLDEQNTLAYNNINNVSAREKSVSSLLRKNYSPPSFMLTDAGRLAETMKYPFYRYVSEKGKNTCEKCADLDGQVFVSFTAKVGVNFPPIHPNCKCDVEWMWEWNGNDTDYIEIIKEADKKEFGEYSDTYKIISDIEKRYRNGLIGKTAFEIAEKARELARAGTPLVFAQERIDGMLLANALTAKNKLEQLKKGRTLDPMDVGIKKREWLASMVNVNCAWDLKTKKEWRLPYDYFDGIDCTGDNEWKKGSEAKFMYYDGMLIHGADLGNINYGYIGTAMGYSQEELYLMGGLVHQATSLLREHQLRLDYWSTYFDASDDYEMVKYGIEKHSKK